MEKLNLSQGWGSSHWERNAVPVPSTHGQTYLPTDSTGAEAQKERRGVPFFPTPDLSQQILVDDRLGHPVSFKLYLCT